MLLVMIVDLHWTMHLLLLVNETQLLFYVLAYYLVYYHCHCIIEN